MEISPIDPYETGAISRAFGINDKGQVVGQSTADGGDLHAFIYLPEDDYGLTAGVYDLTNLAGWSGEQIAFDLNESGIVVGTARISQDPDVADGLLWDLDRRQSHPSDWALDYTSFQPGVMELRSVNDTDPAVAVGFSTDEDNECELDAIDTAFRLVMDTWPPSPEVLDDPSSRRNNGGLSINNADSEGRIVGYAGLCGSITQQCGSDHVTDPARWSFNGSQVSTPLALPTEREGARLTSNNDANEVAGYGVDQLTAQHGLTCRFDAFYWENDEGISDPLAATPVFLVPDDPLGDNESQANAISNAVPSQIVGTNTQANAALLWEKDGNGDWYDAVRLEDRILVTGWELETAQDINLTGQIVGFGLLSTDDRGYILTPHPTTCPTDVSGVGDFPDGHTGVADLLVLLGTWGSCNPDVPCIADFDESGVVDTNDLLELLANWGSCDNPGSEEPPQSVQDCMERYEGYPAHIEACIEALDLLDDEE